MKIDDEKQPESESEIKKAQKLEKNVNESSEKNLASSSIKGNSDKNNKSSTFNTAQVKKGNYESTKDFVIVPQTLVNDYQKNMGKYQHYIFHVSKNKRITL